MFAETEVRNATSTSLIESDGDAPLSILSGGEGSVAAFVQHIERSLPTDDLPQVLAEAPSQYLTTMTDLLPGMTRLACLLAAERAAVDGEDPEAARHFGIEIVRIQCLMADAKRLVVEKDEAAMHEDFVAAIHAKGALESLNLYLSEVDQNGNPEIPSVGFASLEQFQRVKISVKQLLNSSGASQLLQAATEPLNVLVSSGNASVAETSETTFAASTQLEEPVSPRIAHNCDTLPAGATADTVTSLSRSFDSMRDVVGTAVGLTMGNAADQIAACLASPCLVCQDCGGAGRKGIFGPSGFGLLASPCENCGGSGQTAWPSGEEDEDKHDISWEVVWHCGVNVRTAMDSSSAIVSGFDCGHILQGTQHGSWLKLSDRLGYMMISSDKGVLLRCCDVKPENTGTPSSQFIVNSVDEVCEVNAAAFGDFMLSRDQNASVLSKALDECSRMYCDRKGEDRSTVSQDFVEDWPEAFVASPC